MKTIDTFYRIAFAFIFIMSCQFTHAQCRAYIKIDGNVVGTDPTTVSTGLTLPAWLKEGQTLAADQSVNSISVMEFSISGTSLVFSQVLAVTTVQTVPTGKVWKIESIFKQPIFGTNNSVTYSTAGTSTFKVPACADFICVEAWGGGGSGSGFPSNNYGGGGGGGGYGQQCFSVAAGASYTVTVGTGGTGVTTSSGNAGGASSVGALISAGGGNGGSSGNGGSGGTGPATVNITGGTGVNGSSGNFCPGNGGNGANGGAGGSNNCNPAPGTAPGGGGSGSYNNNTSGVGAAGKVVITW